MNIIVLGPQGSGKGTQVQLLVEKYGFNRVEMGDILRSIATSDNPKAEEVRGFMNRGELVPDEFVRLLVWDHINKQDKEKGFIFDGYPRSLAQFEQVSDMLRKFGKRIDLVLSLKLSEDETIKRLSARRTCEKCGKIWNLITNPPSTEEFCECKGRLLQRVDDQPEAIKIRLKTFSEKTVAILDTASKEGILREVDGEQPIAKIHEDIVKVLKDYEQS
jgi:adenylate kinase